MVKISAQELRRLVHYNPETGIMTRRVATSRVPVGSVVGTDMQHGLFARVGGSRQLVHRLAWLYMTGKWPNVIDHINRDPYDNRWTNLRNGTQADNRKNNSRSRHNTSGVHGVMKGRRGKWLARVTHNNKQIWLGEYSTIEEAAEARRAGAARLWGDLAPKGV